MSVPGCCDTFWGSHGCNLAKGHGGMCDCQCDNGRPAGSYPYFGPDTEFFGDDAPVMQARFRVARLTKAINDALVHMEHEHYGWAAQSLREVVR